MGVENMWSMWKIVLLLFLIVEGSVGQNVAEEDSSCYGAGSIAAAVIVTFIVTMLLIYVAYEVWRRYWIKRKRRHLVLETDPERGKDEYAYDNAAFKDATSTPAEKALEKNGKLDSTKSKWSQWSPLGALITKHEKSKTADDSALQSGEIKIVSLKSHDFTGLGFNIYGNMRDGIFIKDILHRGPASESGKLNPGDQIKSVTINFEHIVYEDALTILSYASPYEVTLEAQTSGKINSNVNNYHTGTTGKTVHLGHPLYRSASMTDLIQIQKTSKRRLFPPDEPSSVITNLQKSFSNMATLERKHPDSPKTDANQSSPQQLKSQLEQKILHNYKHQLKAKDEKPPRQEIVESVPVKTENKYPKFGIKVLPMPPINNDSTQPKEQTSPKSAELSQNDNNINLERHLDKQKVVSPPEESVKINIDEVDVVKKLKTVAPPPIKKREKGSPGDSIDKDDKNQTISAVTSEETTTTSEHFTRQHGSGIKRDKDGIPQEIPSHMLNAAVAAKRNRKGSNENVMEDVKSPKKPKGRAPAPPPMTKLGDDANIPNDVDIENETTQTTTTASDKIDGSNYASDSDAETDNRSSVNTIELNSSDITIHQAEDSEDMQNRRTASTGDLTKIQKTYKSNTGTLERAQSLDITDTGVPTISKKRKGGSIEENLESKSGSDDSLYGNALVHKEPRLSLNLDGLNTFQRNRLKKSNEWGNLADAILDLDKDPSIVEVQPDNLSEDNDEKLCNSITTVSLNSPSEYSSISYQINNQPIMVSCNANMPEQTVKILLDNQDLIEPPSPVNFEPSLEVDSEVSVTPPKEEKIVNEPIKLFANSIQATQNFIEGEKELCSSIDPYYRVSNKLYDTNVSDDMKVSRHSLQNNFEILDDSRAINTSINSYNGNLANVSNITISDNNFGDQYLNEKAQTFTEGEDLYITALDTTVMQENLKNNSSTDNSLNYEKTSLTLPSLTSDSNETVIVEGPTSLTLEISNDNMESPIKSHISNKDFRISSISSVPSDPITPPTTITSPKSNYSLTYITEIQVTPTNTKNTSEPLKFDISTSPSSSPDKKSETSSLTNFKENIKHFELQSHSNNSTTNNSLTEKVDPQKELHKIRELAEEQLKKLPEMRFSTSTYESPKQLSDSSQVDQLRSNFERSPPKITPKPETSTKSRIPVATSKTPPTSPERRDSRNFDPLEVDKDIVAIMSSPVHSTPISSNIKYQPKVTSKNVSVTSIRSNSKIPSGFPNRPPVPPRKYENEYENNTSVHRLSTNGNIDSSFKQWVFSPSGDVSANVTVTESKPDHK